jgi:YjjG family noncanonical pyrimidine nucleotidase
VTYTTLLFDLDHTLLDSDTSMAAAYDHTMRSSGVEDPWAHHPVFDRINKGLWAAVERHEISPERVRTARFEQLVAALDLDADPVAMGDRFVEELGANGDLFPEVVEVLDALVRVATMAIVTNGIGQVQRTRISRLGLEPYFDAIVVSGEVGVAKPGTEIFDLVFEQLGMPDRSTALMIGDSLSSDMQGGTNYGIATCWYNPSGLRLPEGQSVTHQIADLRQLLDLVPARERV